MFVIATEAHDDDGLPHTLEHLVFMGSEKYPYKVSDWISGNSVLKYTCYLMHFMSNRQGHSFSLSEIVHNLYFTSLCRSESDNKFKQMSF